MSSTKKILVIGERSSGKLSFVESLTGSLPPDLESSPTHGGLTHEYQITNKYYSALVGIWIDEFTLPSDGAKDTAKHKDSLQEFCDSYCSAEAEQVRASLGAIVVTFRHDQAEERIVQILEQVKRVHDACEAETALLAIGSDSKAKHTDRAEEKSRNVIWEDMCLDEGYEYVNLSAKPGKNEFGETRGIERAREVLAACDWSLISLDPSEEQLLADMMAEDAALNTSLLHQDGVQHGINVDDASLEDLESMMQRIMTAREHLQDLSPEEKKRQAAKLVAEIMKS